MGDLVLMTQPQRSAREHIVVGGSAEILFFTGVRYYRMEEDVPSQTIRRRRSDKVKKASPRRFLERNLSESAPVSA